MKEKGKNQQKKISKDRKEQGGREAIEKGGEPNGFVVHLS